MSNKTPFDRYLEAKQRLAQNSGKNELIPQINGANHFENIPVISPNFDSNKSDNYQRTHRTGSEIAQDAVATTMGAFATTGDNLLSLGGAVVGVGVDALGGNLDDTVKSATSLSHEAKDYWNNQHSDIYKQLQNEASLIDKDENLTEYDRAVAKAKFYFDNPAYATELGAGSLVSSVTQLGLGGVALKGLGVLPKASQLVNSFGLGAGSYIAEENETGEVTKETLANAGMFGALSAFYNVHNRSIEAMLTGAYNAGGKKGLMTFLVNSGIEGGTEFLDELTNRFIHNIENRLPYSHGLGSAGVDGAVLGTTSGAIMGTPHALVAGTSDLNDASKKLKEKAQAVIQDKTDPYDYEVHSNINSDKYQPVRVFDELTKQINTADENVDVQDLIAKRDKLSIDLFNHWHTLKDSLDNETDESKKDDLQKAFEKADKDLRELNLSQQSIQQAEENNNDIFIKTTLDSFYKMQADVERAKNSSINTLIQPNTNNPVKSHGFNDTTVHTHDDIKKLHNFRIPFANLKSGSAHWNGGVVKGDTIGFMQLLDQDDFVFSNAVGFTAITGGKHKKLDGKSHRNGYKIDLDLKGGDSIETYKKVGQYVADLAKRHGYIIQVNAEHGTWGNVGKHGDVQFISGGGSHLDITVIGRTNGQGSVLYTNDNAKKVGKHSGITSINQGTSVSYTNPDGTTTTKIGGTISWRNNNSGNLMFTSAEKAKQRGAIGVDNKGYAIFASEADGDKAREDLLKRVYGKFSIEAMIHKYAPADDGKTPALKGNNPAQYTANVVKYSGLSKDLKIKDLNPMQFNALMSAMKKHEGYKVGKVEGVLPENTGFTTNSDSSSFNQDELATRALNIINDIDNEENISKVKQLEQELGDIRNELESLKQQNQTTQEQPQQTREEQAKELFARASTYTASQIDEVIKSGILSKEQIESLRMLSDVKRMQANLNDVSKVTNELNNGRKGDTPKESHIGLNQYTDILNTAIENQDLEAVNLNMYRLGNLTKSKVNKANALRQALSMNPDVETNPLMIVPDKKGNWNVVQGSTKSDARLKQAGAVDVLKPLSPNVIGFHSAILNEAQGLQTAYNTYSNYIASLQNQGILTKAKIGSNGASTIEIANNIVLPNMGQQVNTSTPTPQATPIATPQAEAQVTKEVVPTKPSKSFKNMDTGNENIKAVYYSKRADYERADDEVWVGKGYAKDENGSTKPVNSLSSLTDTNLANGEHARGRIFNANGLLEAGALGNPYNIKTQGAWNAKNNADAFLKYTDLVKSFANTKDPKRTQFLEDLMSLRGKKLVTSEYEVNEAKFIDEIVNGMPQALADNLINIDPNLPSKERLEQTKEAREWVERIRPKISGTDNVNVRFERDENAIDDIVKQREKRQPNNRNYQKKQENKVSENPTTEVDELALNKPNLENVELTDEEYNDILSQMYESQNQEYIPPYEQDNFQVENNQEVIEPKENTAENVAGNKPKSSGITSKHKTKEVKQAPEEMTARKEVEKLDIDMSSPVGLYDVIDELVANSKSKNKEFLGGLIKKFASLLDNPTIQYGKQFGIDDNQITIKNIKDPLEKLAQVTVHQGVKDLSNDLALASKHTIAQLQHEYDFIVAKHGEDNKVAMDIQQELKYLYKLSNIKRKLQIANTAIINHGIDDFKDKDKINQVLTKPELLLSVGLADKDLVKLFQQIKVKVKDKRKTNVLNYLLNVVQDFFGLNQEEISVFELLTTALGDYTHDRFENLTKGKKAKLSILDVSDEFKQANFDAPYGSRNEFVVAFTQGSSTALSKFINFGKSLKEQTESTLIKILNRDLTENERNSVDDFIDFKDNFTVHLLASFENSKGYEHRDLKGYLYNQETGEIDDNVVTALAYGAYNWLSVNGGKALTTYDDVKFFLNVDKDSNTVIPKRIYKQYEDVLGVLPVIASEIGTNFTKLLDIKETSQAKIGSLSDLQMSVGNWVISAMQVAGLVETMSMDGKQHLANMQEVGGSIPNKLAMTDWSTVNFVKFTKFITEDNQTVNHERVEQISQTNKHSQGVLNELFDVDIGLRFPKLVQPSKVKRTIKGMKTLVSNLQATFINKMQKEAIEIDIGMFDSMTNAMNQFHDEFVNMIGANITDEQLAKLHKNERESAESKAEGYRRELENNIGFIQNLKRDETGFQKFYDSIYVAKNNRMHFNSNVFNMQTSLISRMLASYENFKTKIDVTDVSFDNLVAHALDKDGKPTMLGLYLRALGANLEGSEKFFENKHGDEYSAYTVDKLRSSVFVPTFVEFLKTKEVQDAINAMVKLQTNEKLTKKEIKAIQSFIKTGDMGIQSFRALVELANFKKAIQTGSLTTSLGLGSDGVNNGIAIGSIYNAIGDIKTLIQLGFVPKDNQWLIEDYFDSREHKDIGDYYEAFAQQLESTIKAMDFDDENTNLLNTIVKLQPTLYTRKFAKAIVIPFGYSAGIGRLIQVAEETFVADIQKQLAKLANDFKPKAHQELENNLKVLLGDDFTLPTEPEELLEFWFDDKQEKQLMGVYGKLLGEAIDTALNNFASEFIQARKQNVAMHEATFNLFYDAYQAIVNKATNELADELKLSADEFIKRGFTNAEWEERVVKELKKVMPKVKTAFATTQGDIQNDDSIENVDDIETGIEVFARNTRFVTNRQESKTNRNNKGVLQSITIKLPAKEKLYESAGVFVNSAQIQGTDGRISAEASSMLDGFVNLNIHDQNDSGLAHYIDMVKKQNKVTFDVLATNHIQLNSLETLVDMAKHYHDMYLSGLISEDVYQTTLENITKDEDMDIQSYLNNYITNVSYIEYKKLNNMTNLYSVHQYAGELGHHIVTDDDIKLLEKEKSKIEKRIQNVRNTVAKLNGENTLSTQSQSILDDYTNGSQISIDLFNKLVNINPNQKITILNKDTVVGSGLSDVGMFFDETNEIKVNVESELWYATPLEAINHELIHSVTRDVINTGKYNSQIEALRERISNALLDGSIAIDKNGFIADRIMYFYNSNHELLTVTLAENQIRTALPKDIVVDIESLFSQIVGEFNANTRPNKHQSRENVKDSSQYLSSSNPVQSNGQQSRGQTQSDDNNQRDAQSDVTIASVQIPTPRANQTERLGDNNANRPNQSEPRESIKGSSRDVSDSNRENQSTQRVDRESQSSQDDIRNTSANETLQATQVQVGIDSSLLDKPFTLQSGLDKLLMNADSYSANLSKRFAQLIPDIKIEIVSDISRLDKQVQSDVLAGGMYYPKTNTIIINPKTEDWQSSLIELINHELSHAVTSHVIGFDDLPSKLTDEQIKQFDDIKQIIQIANWESNNSEVNPYLFDRVDYAVTQNFPNELVSVYLSETNSRSFIKQVLGDKTKELDKLIKEIINASTNTRTDVTSEQIGQVEDLSERLDDRATGTIQTSTQSDKESQDIKGIDPFSETNDVSSYSELETEQNQPSRINNSKEFVDKLLSNVTKADKSQITLINFLLPKLVNSTGLEFEWVNKLTYKGEEVYGLYFPDSNVIQLSTSKWKDLSDFDKVALVLHESIHALTEQSIDNPNKQQSEAIQILENMRKQLIAKTKDKDILKRLENIHEFIAYGLTDKMLMNFITDNLDTSSIPLAKKIVNGLSEFFKQVLDLFDWFKKDVKSNKDKQAIYKTFVNHSMALVQAIDNPNNTDMVSEPRASEFNADNVVNEKTAVAVLQDMPTSVSDKFNNHLDKLLDNVAQFYEYNSSNKRTVDRAIKRESNRNLVAWFGLDTKQSHAFEVMKAVIAEYINNQTGTVAINDMRKIYQESKEQLSYEDFLSANPTDLEIQLAKQTYDRLFDSRNGKDYLANFVALSLTSEKFNQVLNKKRERVKRDVNRPLFDRLMRVFDTVVNFFTGLYLHQNGNVNQQLLKISNRLAKIDSNARNEQASLLQTTWEWVGKGFNPVNTAIHQSVAFVMRKLAKLNNHIAKVLTSYLTAQTLKGKDTTFGELQSEFITIGYGRFGEFKNVVNEVVNSGNMTRIMEQMVRYTQKVAQTRQQIKSALQKQMLSQFNNKALSEQERSALTDVVMRSDLGGLLQHLNMAGVMTMATNKTKRNERIKLLEQRILQHKMGNDMLMQAKSLSAYMTHGVTPKHLVKSSEAIALQAGIEVNDISKLNQALYQDIDILVSLYALNNLGNDVQTTFDFLVLDERKAIENIIKQHADVVKQSKAEFKHNPLSYIKGYSPDIVNPYRSLKWVHADEVADLQRQGWEVVTEDLTQDNLDKTDKRVLMYHQDINYQRRVSGALDTADSHSKGTVVYNEYDVMDLQRVVQERHRERMARSQLSYQNFNPFKETGGLVMNISPDSYVIDVHYEMQGFIKDKWLERNNDIFDLLPTMASNLQFKEDIKNQRAILAKVIHKDYLNSYAKDPKLFVVIDPESLDPKVQEDYALMPYDFRQEMKKYFGNKPIVVRSSVYNTVFGYKAWSIGKMFDKTFGERSAFEKQFVKLFEKILGDKAQSRVVQIERVVQFITTMAKDVIVVRSGKVLLGNIIANLLLLGMNGVRPDVVIKDMLFAWREGQRYGKLQNRLYEIEFALKSARGDERKVLNQERHEIVVDMDKHPMRDYMNAGMMSTIVEDTVIFKDKPDFINIYEEKVKKVTDKIPKPMKDTFDWIVINPNTPVYQFLADATQFSDFGAKYVLAKHLQSKGMSFDRAISEAQESFINYDVPTGQGLDYMNRMGLFMFTKFFLRFQKVLAKLFKDKPAQLIVQHQLLENGFDMQGILDPAMPLRFGNNPFEASAFNIFGTGDDLMTYQVISGAF